MSVTTMSTSWFSCSTVSASTPSWANRKLTLTVANLVSEFLLDKHFQVRFVVDNQDPCGHAARSTRVSISLRSVPKSIGFVRSASAPLSSAFRFVSASP